VQNLSLTAEESIQGDPRRSRREDAPSPSSPWPHPGNASW